MTDHKKALGFTLPKSEVFFVSGRKSYSAFFLVIRFFVAGF